MTVCLTKGGRMHHLSTRSGVKVVEPVCLYAITPSNRASIRVEHAASFRPWLIAVTCRTEATVDFGVL